MALPFLAPLIPLITDAAIATGSGTTGAVLGKIGLAAGTAAAAAPFVGAASSGVAQHRMVKAQEKAAEMQRARQKVQVQRERRRIVRESMIARAGIVAQAEAQGVTAGSTARTGALQSVDSNSTYEQSFLNTQAKVGEQQSSFLNKAGRYQQRANLLNTMGNTLNSDEFNRVRTTLFNGTY